MIVATFDFYLLFNYQQCLTYHWFIIIVC